MASNFGQLAMIVDRLLERTEQGGVAWSKSAMRGQFQARFDNFLIQISGVPSTHAGLSSLLNNGGTLRITTLEGTLVDQVLGGSSALGIATALSRNSPPPPQSLLDKIQQLYDMVTNESEDLNRLLKAIG